MPIVSFVVAVHTSHFYWGFATNQKSMWNKWKNHFSEMKGDVGMSLHEKKGNKKMPIPRQEVIDNPIPTSFFLKDVICHHQYPQIIKQLHITKM